jgi:arsenic resistance protein ArsH
MKALIFNGSPEIRSNSTAERVSRFLLQELNDLSVTAEVYNIAEAGIPLFSIPFIKTDAVEEMNRRFREADFHIWLTPLYHGSMTGAMKNCLDWLECSARSQNPYLTGKTIGLVCWADGVQAMQGINAMDSVARALRAWTAPFSVAIRQQELRDDNGDIMPAYRQRFQLLLQLLTQGPNKITAVV